MIEIIPNWHPIFVHFTVALFSISTLFYLLAHVSKNSELQSQWLIVARWTLWAGALITLITVAAGWQAFNTVEHDAPSHAAMTDHRNWAMGAFAFIIIIAVWSVVLHRARVTKNWLFVCLMLIASGVLASTAWRGGEVVFRYGLGVMSLPKVEGEGHAHEHAEGSGHDGVMQESSHLDNAEDKHEQQSMPKKEHLDDGHAH